jgi:hypothetical protein
VRVVTDWVGGDQVGAVRERVGGCGSRGNCRGVPQVVPAVGAKHMVGVDANLNAHENEEGCNPLYEPPGPVGARGNVMLRRGKSTGCLQNSRRARCVHASAGVYVSMRMRAGS